MKREEKRFRSPRSRPYPLEDARASCKQFFAPSISAAHSLYARKHAGCSARGTCLPLPCKTFWTSPILGELQQTTPNATDSFVASSGVAWLGLLAMVP